MYALALFGALWASGLCAENLRGRRGNWYPGVVRCRALAPGLCVWNFVAGVALGAVAGNLRGRRGTW